MKMYIMTFNLGISDQGVPPEKLRDSKLLMAALACDSNPVETNDGKRSRSVCDVMSNGKMPLVLS